MLTGLKTRNEGGGEPQKRKTPRGLIEVVLTLRNILNFYTSYDVDGEGKRLYGFTRELVDSWYSMLLLGYSYIWYKGITRA